MALQNCEAMISKRKVIVDRYDHRDLGALPPPKRQGREGPRSLNQLWERGDGYRGRAQSPTHLQPQDPGALRAQNVPDPGRVAPGKQNPCRGHGRQGRPDAPDLRLLRSAIIHRDSSQPPHRSPDPRPGLPENWDPGLQAPRAGFRVSCLGPMIGACSYRPCVAQPNSLGPGQ